jgi:hypothetical protein
MRKAASSQPTAPASVTLQIPHEPPSVTVAEIERAHAVLTALEVENRKLCAEHALLLKVARLAAMHSAELAVSLKDLPGGDDVAQKVLISTAHTFKLSAAEAAWVEKHVTLPAIALLAQMKEQGQP